MPRTVIFALSIGIAALQLFVLESVVGKQLLPLAGGGPMIWNTCLVFFQVALLTAYLLAYLLSRGTSFIVQSVFVIAALVVSVIGPTFLRDGVTTAPPLGGSPAIWLWSWLISAVLLPFVALGMLSPLLQHWFSQGGNNDKEPYPLYAASNLGSFLGILAYPLYLERATTLSQQRSFLLVTVTLVLCSVLECIILSIRRGGKIARLPEMADDSGLAGESKIILWIALSALPSSLLLSVTNYILTDISALPLFWIVPLLIYLLTFVISFSALDSLPVKRIGRIAAFASLLLAIVTVVDANSPILLIILLHLVTFAVVTLFCHGLLVSVRPRNREMVTTFYLWIAFGGAFGGLVTLLICPLLFTRQLEYPIALVLVCMIRQYRGTKGISQIALLKAVGIVVLIIAGSEVLPQLLPTKFEALRVQLAFIPAGVLALSCIAVPSEYSLAVAAIVLAGTIIPSGLGNTIISNRNFFGITRVTIKDGFHEIVHGSTIHGIQSIASMGECEPTSYFHRTGPAGDILGQRDSGRHKVLVIGLGVGSLACYANPDEQWIFYELNPAMEQIARNEKLFTFLKNSKAEKLDVSLGDGRRLLAAETSKLFDMIVVDAFSSDSIPTHLLTKEAFELYLSRLSPNGRLLIHISNRFFNLRPILAENAALLPVTAYIRDNLNINSDDAQMGKTPSTWVFMVPNSTDAKPPSDSWILLHSSGIRPWTDDFSDPVSALNLF